MVDDRDRPERPRLEPEIIPPDRSQPGRPWRTRETVELGDTQRVYVTRLGPFGGLLLLLVIVILAAVFLAVFLGALLIWLPIVGLIAIVAVLSGVLRLRR